MLPFAMLLAWLMAKKKFRGKGIVNSVIHLPLVIPPVVTGYILLVLLGKRGYLGGFLYKTFGITLAFDWKGAVVASAVMGFPLMVRAIQLSFEFIDGRLIEAARTLGAGRIHLFLTIIFPLSLPGIITGMILAFARSLGEFGATITFVSNIEGRTRTIPLAIYTYLQSPGGEKGAAKLVMLSIVVSLVALVISEMLTQKMKRGREN